MNGKDGEGLFELELELDGETDAEGLTDALVLLDGDILGLDDADGL
jgi:hypothetical protein